MQRELRDFKPIADRVSLYVCRPMQGWANAGVVSTIVVDGKEIGGLKPHSFVHTSVDPGKHNILMKSSGLMLTTPSIEFEARAGELVFMWVGSTAAGLGAYTIDFFKPNSAAENCVLEAAYNVSGQ